MDTLRDCMTGLWYDPSNSGEGLSVQVQDGKLVATFYTFDDSKFSFVDGQWVADDPKPVWYISDQVENVNEENEVSALFYAATASKLVLGTNRQLVADVSAVRKGTFKVLGDDTMEFTFENIETMFSPLPPAELLKHTFTFQRLTGGC